MTYHIGITASRNPPTYVQLMMLLQSLYSDKLLAKVFKHDRFWFHHGDCINGDELAHDIAKIVGYKTHIHPPLDGRLRAYKVGNKMEPEKDYLARNRDIVDAVAKLYVLPDTFEEKKRSGTWSTWRYAKSIEKPWRIIYPDGSVQTSWEIVDDEQS